MYLNDTDLINTLVRCRSNLTSDNNKTGLIIVKENVKKSGAYLDKSDNSLVRSEFYFKIIFEVCGLEILHSSYQPDWDQDLMAICMWVLRPLLPKRLTFEPIKKDTNYLTKNERVN